MRGRHSQRLMALVFVVSALLSVYFGESTVERIRQIRAVNQMSTVQSVLDAYASKEGYYPLQLSDLDVFADTALSDPWGIPLHYERGGDGYSARVTSHQCDVSRRQSRLRQTVRHGLVVLATFALLCVLALRSYDTGLDVARNASLLASFLVGTYAYLGNCGMVSLFGSVLWFYAMLFTATVLSLAAIIAAVRQRTPCRLVEVANMLYAIPSVLEVVS